MGPAGAQAANCNPGLALSSSIALPRRLLASRPLRSAQPLTCRRPLQPRGLPPPAAAAGQWPGGTDRQEQQQEQPQPTDRQLVEADTIIDPDGTVRLQPQSVEDRRDLWKRAIKLPMYSVGWAPILVGSGLAGLDGAALDRCMLSSEGGAASDREEFYQPAAAEVVAVGGAAWHCKEGPPLCQHACAALNAQLALAAWLQVSAASAYVQTGTFDVVRTLLLCVAATAVIGWLNLRCGGMRSRLSCS